MGWYKAVELALTCLHYSTQKSNHTSKLAQKMKQTSECGLNINLYPVSSKLNIYLKYIHIYKNKSNRRESTKFM